MRTANAVEWQVSGQHALGQARQANKHHSSVDQLRLHLLPLTDVARMEVLCVGSARRRPSLQSDLAAYATTAGGAAASG